MCVSRGCFDGHVLLNSSIALPESLCVASAGCGRGPRHPQPGAAKRQLQPTNTIRTRARARRTARARATKFPRARRALASTLTLRVGTRRLCLLLEHHSSRSSRIPRTRCSATLLAVRSLCIAAAPLAPRAAAAAVLLAPSLFAARALRAQPALRCLLSGTRRGLRVCAPLQRPRAAVGKPLERRGTGSAGESSRPMRVLCVAEKRECDTWRRCATADA